MSELAEFYRELREESQARKWEWYKSNRKTLVDNGIPFVEKDNGHFIVGEYDFWGTTGLFIHRKTKKRGRGINNLLKRLEAKENE